MNSAHTQIVCVTYLNRLVKADMGKGLGKLQCLCCVVLFIPRTLIRVHGHAGSRNANGGSEYLGRLDIGYPAH